MFLILHAIKSLLRNRGRTLLMLTQLLVGMAALSIAIGLWFGIYIPENRTRSVGMMHSVIGVAGIDIPVPPADEVMEVPGVDEYIVQHRAGFKDEFISVFVNTGYLGTFDHRVDVGRFLTPEDIEGGSSTLAVVVSTALAEEESERFSLDSVLHMSGRIDAEVVGVLNEAEKIWVTPELITLHSKEDRFILLPYRSELLWLGDFMPTIRLTIIPSEGTDPDNLVQRLTARWPKVPFQPMQSFLKNKRNETRELRLWLTYIATVCLIVAVIGFASGQVFSMQRRLRQVGVQFAFGAKPRYFIIQMMLEAGILLVIPYAASLGTGTYFAEFAADKSIAYSFNLQTALYIVGIAVPMLLAAILPPALYIAKLSPAELLRKR
jgi:hypothetical protein